MKYDLSGRTILEIPEYYQLLNVLACMLPEFPSLRCLPADAVLEEVLAPRYEKLERLRYAIRNTPDHPYMRRGNGGSLEPVTPARFGFFGRRIRVQRGLRVTPQIGSVTFFICAEAERFYFIVDSVNSYPFALETLECGFMKIKGLFGLEPRGGAFSNRYGKFAILCHRPDVFDDVAIPKAEKRASHSLSSTV